jgi:hypothetical protein
VEGVEVVVEVANDSAETVTDLTVVVGNQIEQVGDLAAGEQLTHTVEGRLALTHLNVQAMRGGAVGNPFGGGVALDGAFVQTAPPPIPPGGFGVQDGMAMPGMVGPFGMAAGLYPAPPRVGSPGVAWAVGTVAAADLPATVEDAAAEEVSSTIAVGSRIDVLPPAQRVPPAAVLGQVLLPQNTSFPVNVTAPTFGQETIRFRLPPLAPSSRLAAALQGVVGNTTAQVWDATARMWRDVASDAADLDPVALLTASGELYVRLTGPVDGAGIAVTQPGDPPARPAIQVDGQMGFATPFIIPEPPMGPPLPVITLTPVPLPPMPLPVPSLGPGQGVPAPLPVPTAPPAPPAPTPGEAGATMSA